MSFRSILFFAMALSPIACTSESISGASGTGGTSSASGTSSTGGGISSLCPATEPEGGACDTDGQHCTWGDEVRAECRRARTCTSGEWSAPEPACVTPPADHCAFTEPPPGVCSHYGDICIVGAATICRCDVSNGGPSDPEPTWRCAAPPDTAGCPTTAPNDGTACTSEGLRCNYGNFCIQLGASARCTGGTWRWNLDTNDITCGS